MSPISSSTMPSQILPRLSRRQLRTPCRLWSSGCQVPPGTRQVAWSRHLAATAQQQRWDTGADKVRLFGETTYHAASWDHPRRVVIKAEALPKGPNTRFVVITRPDQPAALYAWYVARGGGENAIKDLKLACFADRLSDHRFWANQFRLLLHAAAYWLLDTVRRWLRAMQVERMQLDTLRLRLLKVGGRVWQHADRVRLRLAASHPGQPLWHLLATRPKRFVKDPG